jgi:ribosomal protein L16 Arg81 hydroxylase
MATSEAEEMPENLRFDLARLLDPVSPSTFFGEHWEEKPLLVSRNRPDYYEALLSLDEIDRLISSAGLPPDAVSVANADAATQDEFARADGSVDVVKTCQLFSAGATIVLQDAHKWLGPLAALCRGLECEFSAPLQTNLYMTPPHGQGFETHYDTHDVFVLQVEGTKEWTIFDAPVRLPLRGQPFDPDLHPVGAATMSFVLDAGDLLYIPRGFLHHARSGDRTSLHVTLGVISHRWADVLLEVMAETCLSDPAFRRALPVGIARAEFDAASARRIFADLLARAIEKASPDRVLDRLADEFVVSRRALVPGQLAQMSRLQDLSALDEVGVRPALIYRLRTDGDVLRIRSHGREMSLPAEAGDAVKFALENERYRVRDLPGDIDEAEKVVLVRRLIEEGLVTQRGGGDACGKSPRGAQRPAGSR